MKSNLEAALLCIILATAEVHTQNNCFQSDDLQLHFVCPIDYAQVGGFQMKVTPLKEIIIECSSLGAFAHLPDIILAHINLLHFKNCPLPQNFKKILDELSTKDVVEIKFENGDLENRTVDKSHFRGLGHLENLVLTKNKFTELDRDLFGNTPNLVNLNLKQNFLRKLQPGFFEKTPSLEWLELDDNNLSSLPDDLFTPLNKLEYLGLSNNKLVHLNGSTFLTLRNLKFLDLGGNRITRIAESALVGLINLVNISLKMNRIRLLPPNLFRNNTKLQVVLLNDNRNFTLSEYSFANMFKLEEVGLSNCDLVDIPENVFENSTELKILNFQKNRLEKISPNLLTHLIYLEELNLASNRIENVENIFFSLRNLRKLFLQENRIKMMSERTFFGLIRLEELYFQHNEITEIHKQAFFNNHRLRIIDLSQNQFSGGEVIFENTVALEEVNLSHNSIRRIEDVITLNNKFVLEVLDLRHNLISNISLTTLIAASETEIFLDYNRITHVSFEELEFVDPYYTSIINLRDNPISCDCTNFDLVKYLRGESPDDIHQKFFIREGVTCGSPEELESKRLEEVPLSILTCPAGKNIPCPGRCSCQWRPFDESVVINCANLNLTEFPKIEATYNRLEVNLENNSLVGEEMVGYENVTKLFLSGNNLTSISWVPPRLEMLKLDHNELTSLDNEVLRSLSSSVLSQLTLNNNPWSCECGSENLTGFVRRHSKILDFNNIFCVNTTIRLSDLHEGDLCRDFTLACITATISFLLVCVVSTSFYYRYRQEIKIWLFSKNLCLFWVSEEDVDHDKIYDAFISYSHRDEDFVKTVVEELENGSTCYKLCLHYRDWIPGELINVQIARSIASSRRTVVILSENFIDSVWARAEFQQAHAEAMAEGRARIILVLFGDLDLDKLDENLKAYLKTSTYLKWGDPYFWNKLKYALPHHRIVLKV